MSNYYAKRDARVNIAHALMDLGWKVYGYKEDQSDSMTDYYSPADWDGIATKNGFILVVDNRCGSEPREIKKYNPKGSLSPEDQDKITKLSKMTMANGATEGEEQNAKILIEKLQVKVSNEPQYFVTGVIPGYMANPGKCKWHIEKDGKIYDKGTGITKYSDVPSSWEFNIIKMEFKPGRDTWFGGEKKVLSEEQLKAANALKQLLMRFERVVNNMNSCGDGTAETEKEGLEQKQKEGYEKVTVEEVKKVIRPVQKEDNTINMNDVLSFSYHGHYWIVINIYQNSKDQTCIVYELLGKESRGYQRLKNGKRYYQPLERLQKEMTEGKVKVYTLQEVEETTEVEKWVKINNKKPNNKQAKTEQKEQTKQQETKEQPTQEQTTDNILNHEITITADTDTRDNSPLWVVKIVDSLSKEEYKKVAEQLKELKGYYSKFKHGFIFKYDPAEVLKGEQEQQKETTKEETNRPQEQVTAEELTDISADIIIELNIDGATISDNNEYKTRLYDYIKSNKITITEGVLSYLKAKGYTKLVDILETFNAEYWKPIKDGFYYDCHFKEWKIPMSEIHEAVKALNIPFTDWVDKIGFFGITAEQAKQVREISDINESILFIDAEMTLEELNRIEKEIDPPKQEREEEPEKENIINFEDYKNNSEVEDMNNNFDDILSKFDDIEINNNSRITADDQAFCEEEQSKYSEAITLMLNLIEEIKKVSGMNLLNGKWYDEKTSNKYLDSYKLKEMKIIVDGMKENFIDEITSYFSQKYNITIKKERMQKNYDYHITYNNIIDDIVLQLDGFTFSEKAVKELKDKTRTTYHYSDYRKSSNMSIKNNKIIIDGSYAYKDSIWNQYKLTGDFGKIFTALYHFENGTIPKDGTELHNKYCGYANEKNEDNYDKYNPATLTKVNSIKFFKNGKLEIEFKNAQHAIYFAKEYLGYMEKSA